MVRASRQRGMGLLGILAILGVLGFVVLLIVRVGPLYMTYWTLTSVMNDVAHSPEPTLGGSAGIYRRLTDRMMVNEIRSVDPRSFQIQKTDDNAYRIALAYEQRAHLFANVDVVVSFDHEVAVQGR